MCLNSGYFNRDKCDSQLLFNFLKSLCIKDPFYVTRPLSFGVESILLVPFTAVVTAIEIHEGLWSG